jgi:hypothetical protein
VLIASRGKQTSGTFKVIVPLCYFSTALPPGDLELWRDMHGHETPLNLGEAFKESIAKREPWVWKKVANSTTTPLEQQGRGPGIKAKGAANTSSSQELAVKKLTRKVTTGQTKRQSGKVILGGRVKPGHTNNFAGSCGSIPCCSRRTLGVS